MRSSRSAQVIIASNDDLLTELLLRLPVKSLLRFKCVSKHWLSLITHPHFIARKSLKPCAASALYVNCWSPDSDGYPIFRNSNEVVPLHHPYSQTRAAYNDITFADYPEYGIEILHSCNGLLCCRNSWNGDYRVCNPTTKRFTTLPPIPVSGFHLVSGANLAFDPSKSPVYKIVCVQESRQLPHNLCQILIYSSETGCWRVSGVPFNNLFSVDFFNGVYWNGALYWASQVKPSIFIYFDMGQEILRELPLPPRLAIMYFGESCGHLHLVGYNNNSTPTHFNVYEMESDRWFVKFSIDFNGMVPSYPDLILPILLFLGRGEKEEDSFLVLYINGQVVRYNFIRQTHSEIWNIGCPTTPTGRAARPFLKVRYLGPVVFQYIESLSLV